MIRSLLIANRGEIACRIIRTARAMGVRTVAVYSDADAKALHVRQADEAVHIGASTARESYLVGEKIIAAAQATGAEAIHPGYGFLSENADFAQSVIDAGLIWVGPRPASIRAMGLKDAAKQRMIAAGVPVTPGYLGADQNPDHLRGEADKIGYPVLIKAVAGGGGKGMRRVEASGDFLDALGSCQREAASSFGDDRVLIEKYILSPRHIEVQVFGDTHGNVVHLFERDCSLQRRHQKVIEEAPAPGMDAATREAICAAAVRAAQAVDYVGAGTIEFIADASEGLRADRIWFMEMNTRLQVEHPVTEEITGVDLVEWQLRVASGERLPKRQDELRINGHAVEARIYAEDPAKGFLPSIGKLEVVSFPERFRVDTGVSAGDEVTPFYDPMIAKIIVCGDDREAAFGLIKMAFWRTVIAPIRTNAGFLSRLVQLPEVLTGALHTNLINERLTEVDLPNQVVEALNEDAATALVASYAHRSLDLEPGIQIGDLAGHDVWHAAIGFRLNSVSASQVALYRAGERTIAHLPDGFETRRLHNHFNADGSMSVMRNGETLTYTDRRSNYTSAGAADGAILSPMPGRIIAVEVAAGDAVAKGQKLVTLEAMKMEHSLVAPFDGTVAELSAAAGGQVSEGALLVRIERGEVE